MMTVEILQVADDGYLYMATDTSQNLPTLQAGWIHKLTN